MLDEDFATGMDVETGGKIGLGRRKGGGHALALEIVEWGRMVGMTNSGKVARQEDGLDASGLAFRLVAENPVEAWGRVTHDAGVFVGPALLDVEHVVGALMSL